MKNFLLVLLLSIFAFGCGSDNPVDGEGGSGSVKGSWKAISTTNEVDGVKVEISGDAFFERTGSMMMKFEGSSYREYAEKDGKVRMSSGEYWIEDDILFQREDGDDEAEGIRFERDGNKLLFFISNDDGNIEIIFEKVDNDYFDNKVEEEEQRQLEEEMRFKPSKVIVSIDYYSERGELDFSLFGSTAGDPYFIITCNGGSGTRSKESRVYEDMSSISNPFEAEFPLEDDLDELEFSIVVYDSDATEDDQLDYCPESGFSYTHTISMEGITADNNEETWTFTGNSEKSCRLKYSVRIEE